ncbi:MAG: hypothetical protein ACKV2U_11030 [Bryobacteraceae bacterium]
MRRFHLIELEDQDWMPAVIRDGVTDYLSAAIRVGNTYGPVTSALANALLTSGEERVIDLCAGGGGPWQTLLPALRTKGWAGTVTLTDRFPNSKAVERLTTGVTYYPESVDALEVPKELSGFRTLFTAFHHFPPAAARALLADAAAKAAPIALFEVTHRSPRYIFAMLFSPLTVMILTPVIRPFSWSRLLFTYLIPLVPLVVTWDGIVSCLRTYTVAELRSMTMEIPGNHRWDVGEVKGKGLLPLTYLFGLPQQ